MMPGGCAGNLFLMVERAFCSRKPEKKLLAIDKKTMVLSRWTKRERGEPSHEKGQG